MISYDPLFATMQDRRISSYALRFRFGFSSNTYWRITKGEAISTKTINTLCEILDCGVSDIIEYKPDE